MAVGRAATINEARQWRIQYSLTYPVLSDEQQTVTALFCPDWGGGTGLYILPHCCIVDDHQILQWSHFGWEPNITIMEIDSIVNVLFDPEISSSTTAIEFIDVELGTTAEFTLYLDNSGTGILDVTQAVVSGSPFSVNFTPGEIFALNDSLAVTVIFSPEEPGPFSDVLTITSNAGELQIPITGSVGVNDPPGKTLPLEFTLKGNYPNPFNCETIIEFVLPAPSNVKLEVYSTSGKMAASDNPSQIFPAGQQQMTFNGSGLPSGLYFYRLTAGENRAVGKMILLK